MHRMNGPRDELMDNLKGVLIILVVFSHFLVLYVDAGVASLPVQVLYYFIYSFHMPLFVFVSGYFSKNLDQARNTAFARLFIPYLFFNTAMLLFLDATGQGRLDLFTPQYAYWYLLALFVWRLALKDLVRIRFILPLSVFLSLLSGFHTQVNNFLAIARIINFLPFFLLGYYTDRASISKLRSVPKLLAAGGLVLSFAWIWWLTGTGSLSTRFFITMPYASLREVCLRPAFYLLAPAISACVVILCPARRLALLTVAGESTFLIYVLHRYVNFAANRLVPVEYWNDLYVFPLMALTVLAVLALSHRSLRHVYDKLLEGLLRAIQVRPSGDRMSTGHVGDSRPL